MSYTQTLYEVLPDYISKKVVTKKTDTNSGNMVTTKKMML